MERKEGIVAGAAVGLVFYTLALVALGPIVSSALTGNRIISNTGSVTAIGLGVYLEQACVNPVSSINWGILDPGANVEKTVYIRNEGTTVASLAMTTSNWSPSSASSYLTVSWNYGGQTIAVNEVIQVKFTLSVSSTIEGITTFSFDITITAS